MSLEDGSLETLVCLITTPTDKATSIARSIVEQKLAACINIIPAVRSIYWWEDKVNEQEESLLVLKTTTKLLTVLNDALKAIHPYETFELVALEIKGGNVEYLNWITSSVGSKNSIETDYNK